MPKHTSQSDRLPPASITPFGRLTTELWLVTSQSKERRGGLIATFVMPASIVPPKPRLVVAIAQQHHTWGLIRQSNSFAAHLLGKDNIELVWQFGLQSGHDVDKFAGVEYQIGLTDNPIVAGTLGHVECRVEASVDIGDRMLFVGDVVAGDELRDGEPLTTETLFSLASERQRQLLQDRLQRDVEIDNQAIQQWRRSRQ